MNAPFKIQEVLAEAVVGITDLKRNPSAVIEEARYRQVAILNRNKPVAYVVSPETWEKFVDMMEEREDAELARERLNDPNAEYVEVDLEDLA